MKDKTLAIALDFLAFSGLSHYIANITKDV